MRRVSQRNKSRLRLVFFSLIFSSFDSSLGNRWRWCFTVEDLVAGRKGRFLSVVNGYGSGGNRNKPVQVKGQEGDGRSVFGSEGLTPPFTSATMVSLCFSFKTAPRITTTTNPILHEAGESTF
ncbi:unnamed protein product [Lactuca saligna]|uniref:Secreted protein n=1 Tax=Lactuca saligna TaxID=75948 RepID=A0AA35ZFB2_LACSI|nr:unnamed protein product [Lactuca saligna]